MKNFKKALALILSVLMLCSAMMFTASAADGGFLGGYATSGRNGYSQFGNFSENDPFVTEVFYDATAGFPYAHVTLISDISASGGFCFNNYAKDITMPNGKVYAAMYMRTNVQVTPGITFAQLTMDGATERSGNAVHAFAESAAVGSGEWEKVIVYGERADAVKFFQPRIRPFGAPFTRSGGEYVDLAGVAFFGTLEEAEAYDMAASLAVSKVTVSFEADGSVFKAVDTCAGEKVRVDDIEVPVPEGKKFVGWQPALAIVTGKGGVEGTEFINAPSADVTYTAVLEEIDLSVPNGFSFVPATEAYGDDAKLVFEEALPNDVEIKKASEDWSAAELIEAGATEITGLAAGIYELRYAGADGVATAQVWTTFPADANVYYISDSGFGNGKSPDAPASFSTKLPTAVANFKSAYPDYASKDAYIVLVGDCTQIANAGNIQAGGIPNLTFTAEEGAVLHLLSHINLANATAPELVTFKDIDIILGDPAKDKSNINGEIYFSAYGSEVLFDNVSIIGYATGTDGTTRNVGLYLHSFADGGGTYTSVNHGTITVNSPNLTIAQTRASGYNECHVTGDVSYVIEDANIVAFGIGGHGPKAENIGGSKGVINGGTFGSITVGPASSGFVTGSAAVVINGIGTLTGSITAKDSTKVTKDTVLILNNGLANTLGGKVNTANLDYYIQSGIGGSADVIFTESGAKEAESFAFTTDKAYVVIDGGYYEPEDGVLTLALDAGTHTVEYTNVDTRYTEVYVSASGSDDNDGRTAENALATFGAAYDKVKADGGTVYVVGDFPFAGEFSVGNGEVVVTGDPDSETKAILRMAGSVNFNGAASHLTAGIRFENINFAVSEAMQWKFINFKGTAYEFGEGVGMLTGTDPDGKSYKTLCIRAGGEGAANIYGGKQIIRSGSFNTAHLASKSTGTFGDIDFEFYGGSAGINCGNDGDNGKTGILTNVKVLLNAAPRSYGHSNISAITGNYQFIANNGVATVPTIPESVTYDENKFWAISSAEGGMAAFTETAGTFAFDTECKYVVVDGEDYYEASESPIALAAGVHNVTYTDEEPAVMYNVTVSIGDLTESGKVEENTELTLPDAGVIPASYNIIGWYDGTDFLPLGATYTITKDVDFVGVALDLEQAAGASVRMVDPTGLRFTSFVDAEEYDFLAGISSDVKFGTIILPVDYIVDTVTFADLDSAGITYLNIVNEAFADENDLYKEFRSVISNIKTANYSRLFVGRSYVSFTYSDGTEGIVYADIDIDRNARSVKDVAAAALADASATYTDAQRTVLEGFAG